ncbi:hypothetical protein BD560DRAFT_393767 [Blakeslea trispora]|nr:hypothetical protein BD560DRAFT_393767 [Blakeslea trispora]
MLYDEFNFVPDQTVEPSNLMNPTIINEPSMAKRRSSSSTSSLSSYSSSSEEEEDDNTFSTLHSQRSSMDSSDEEDLSQNVMKPSLMHRRQMEETILEKITQQLDAEKLPGILSIIAEKHEEHVEEVEIDLAKLKYNHLEQILLYIEACLHEKNGGPKVKLTDFVPKPAKNKSKKDVRQRQKQRRPSTLAGTGHIVNGSSTSRLSESHGPISMSALTQLEREEEAFTSTKRRNNRRKGPKKNKSKFNKTIPPVKKLPKRKTALHKRRLLEEMIQPSLSDDDEEENDTKEGGIIIFGNEQMDFAVKDNQTIVHNSCLEDKAPIVPAIDCRSIDDDEDDELIDIML